MERFFNQRPSGGFFISGRTLEDLLNLGDIQETMSGSQIIHSRDYLGVENYFSTDFILLAYWGLEDLLNLGHIQEAFLI